MLQRTLKFIPANYLRVFVFVIYLRITYQCLSTSGTTVPTTGCDACEISQVLIDNTSVANALNLVSMLNTGGDCFTWTFNCTNTLSSAQAYIVFNNQSATATNDSSVSTVIRNLTCDSTGQWIYTVFGSPTVVNQISCRYNTTT